LLGLLTKNKHIFYILIGLFILFLLNSYIYGTLKQIKRYVIYTSCFVNIKTRHDEKDNIIISYYTKYYKKNWDNCRYVLPYPYMEKDAEQFISFVEGQSAQTGY
jgi:acetyltransferase